jgi:hypothetical protein
MLVPGDARKLITVLSRVHQQIGSWVLDYGAGGVGGSWTAPERAAGSGSSTVPRRSVRLPGSPAVGNKMNIPTRPHITYYSNLRGYLRATVEPTQITAEFRAVDKVSVADRPRTWCVPSSTGSRVGRLTVDAT